jgi:Recombinase
MHHSMQISLRQRRRRAKEQRHAARRAVELASDDSPLAGPVEPLAHTREQAAQALGVSLATLDRRVVPTIATVKTEWGARLIPASELERYLADRREQPRRERRRTAPSGRKPALPPEVVARIRREHAQGASLGEIARRLNHDDIPTGQGGRQWWPSKVRVVLLRSSQPGSARAAGA